MTLSVRRLRATEPSRLFDRPVRTVFRCAWAVIGLAALHCGASGQSLVNPGDRRFMVDAASSGMVEIVLGRVAEEKAANDAVRRFGSRMVDDHNQANEELKAMALAKSVPLPTGLTSDQKAMVGQMKKRKGASFDQAYLSRMVQDHRRLVTLFEHAGSSADDADVKAYAGRTLAVLRAHLQMAQQLSGNASAAPATAAARLPVKPVTRE